MAQSTRVGGGGVGRYYTVGDYMVGKQIGAGSFSTVWHARHRVHGTEVAIKEIVTARLNPKLQESLKSEIFILKRINHPNIIRLHDMIEESGKIYIVLEYCKGGDLSMYIQRRQGKIPEATAKHFMLQLAEGLKILREYSLIHRDLKPQNLLLSANDDNSVLKIADFGFARSLQHRSLAETLCGSPLYMAPEIMQLQKYDAKADLWSVGAILFQLVTGKTPFTGSNQIQLLQNIVKSTELQFPPEAKDLSPHCIDLCRKLLRRNPVERLTYEEFFNHQYFSQRPDESFRNKQSQRAIDRFPAPSTEENSQEDCLPFVLDGDSIDRSPSIAKGSTIRPTYGFSVDSKPDQGGICNLPNRIDSTSKYSTSPLKQEISGPNLGNCRPSEGNLKEFLKASDRGSSDKYQERIVDYSLESIDQDYVFVSGASMDLSSSGRTSKIITHLPSKTDSRFLDSTGSTTGAPLPIIGKVGYTGNTESRIPTSEHPSTHSITRIKVLQQFASAITELVNEKVNGEKHLEAFSVQLVILAIWKQALHICHTHAASAMDTVGPADLCSQFEQKFLHEVGNAEELAKQIEPGNSEMPDAMELIYQAALALGRHGAVDEYMNKMENAVVFYSKAVDLLVFLLVEAPSLILNPPFSLTDLDRYRIQQYIDALNNRQTISRSQRLELFKSEN